jgi:hypothetical protein
LEELITKGVKSAEPLSMYAAAVGTAAWLTIKIIMTFLPFLVSELVSQQSMLELLWAD